MAIKGLTPQLAERGKIKIGGLGDERKKQGSQETYKLPVKYDYILITTMQRDQAGRLMPDTELMDRILQAQEVQKLTEIPVRLLYDDIDLNFPTRYSCYKGNRCWCTGDGERAQRLGEGRIEDKSVSPGFRQAGANEYGEVSCPCERLEATYSQKDKCKPMGTLQVLLEGVDRVGGVWRFRTTSWNTVNAILSSLVLIKTITGGILSGIPLHLVLSPKTVTVPNSGQNQVVYIMSLEYRGQEEKLAELGYDIAKRRIEHRIKMESMEAEARKLLVAPHQEPVEEQKATAEEYYPEGTVLDLDQQPPGPYVPPGLNATPAGDGSPKKPKTTPAKPTREKVATIPRETKRPEPQAVTLPELMEICHKGQDLTAPLPIRSHKPGAENLGTLKGWERDPGTNKYSLVLYLAPNLKEITDGLTAEMIVKSFAEAKITVKVANLQVLGAEDRCTPSPSSPAPVTGPCHYHPDLAASWRDDQGKNRCTNCPGTSPTHEEVPPGREGSPGPAITTPPPQGRGNTRPQGERKSLF
ncbi:MAG: hypothetical protein HY787_08535 [Deltaproteobacteria bacterium]|nr:hypothetical protein [Deltaproteobacteria bacterium]